MAPKTLAAIQRLDGYKPRCVWCHVPCDRRSREYRAVRLCPYCYDEQPPLTVTRKELLCKR